MKRLFLASFMLCLASAFAFSQDEEQTVSRISRLNPDEAQVGKIGPIGIGVKPVLPNKNIMMVEENSEYDCVVMALTEDIIRVSYVKKGESEKAPKLMLNIDKRPECKVDGNAVSSSLLTASGLCVTARSGSVTISDGFRRTVVSEGMPQVIDGKQVVKLHLSSEAPLYGAGERGHSLNLLGDTLVCYNRQNYGYTEGDPRISQMGITMPMLLSQNGFAVLFDDFAASTLYAGNPIVYTSENVTEPISFYFVRSSEVMNYSMAGVVKNVSQLTGRQQLPPLWSLGYITSKYGYRTQKETLGVIDTLKRKGYPVDGIVLDLYWYGKEQDMGSLSWEKKQWPNHVKMLRKLKQQGVNLVAISQPYVLRNGRGLENYNEFAQKGIFCTDSLGNPHEVKIWVGEGGMFDVSNPDTYTWLYNRYKLLTDEGVTGWWGDLGEPEVHPETAFHHNGLSARLYHNVYGNDWSKIIDDLFKNEYPNTRLMTLMRGGTIGLQRYNVFPWSTDVSRSWGGLQPQVKIMLNSGLSGMGYMSHDVGGFAIDPKNPVDPELYIRWLQLGLFSPVLRTHAQQVAEPYKYPEYQDIILPLIKERYRWLPYNYTLAFENASIGLPLVRPLNFYNQAGDFRYSDVQDQYLWGHDIMIAPVLTQGAKSRKVVIPEGKWVDMNDLTKVYSNTVIDYPVELATIPMFVRAGAVIPMAEYKMKNVGDYRTDTYDLHYYFDKTEPAFCTLYEDDLTSPSHFGEENEHPFASTGFFSDETGLSIVTIVENGYEPKTKVFNFTVHNADKPNQVLINEKSSVEFAYDEQTRTITFTLNYNPAEGCFISFK